MKTVLRILCVIPFILFSLTVLNSQSLKNLEDNNGFKKYKLGSRFVLSTGVKMKNEEGGDKVVIDYTTETISDIPVKTIELIYLRDTLSKIVVRVLPEFYSSLLEACINSFGQPTEDNRTGTGNYSTERYIWKGKRFNLEYYYNYPSVSGGGYGKKDLFLSYTLNDFIQRMQRTKTGNYSAKDF